MAENIIINGCDVSGCKHYKSRTCIADYCLTDMPFGEAKCELNPNCHYKQFKVKEQECERTKERLESFQKDYSKLYQVVENKGYIKELDQLKAENNKYALFIEKLCDYAGLECDDEEQAMRTLSDLASQMNKARWIIDKYKQTLTEIKEIAEKTLNMVDYKTYFKRDNKSLKQESFKAIDKILQKISECEGNNVRS